MGADGVLAIADGPYAYTLKPGADLQLAGMMFTPGFPGHARGMAAAGAGTVIVTTANGQVSRWMPAQHEHQVLTDGYDRLYGVAVASDGAVAFAEGGTGRALCVRNGQVDTLVEGLLEPRGVAFATDGGCLVAESGGGRVVRLSGGRAETILDGLRDPQGLVVHDGTLYVVDAGTKEVVAYHLARKTRRTIAGGLPVGAPPGVAPKFLRAIPPLSGPMGPFTGITAGADGTLYVSGDAEGSVLAIRAA
jgi:glucose/arabinose dehydrogenase